jgi:N-dimethylarginine dimethylaminohydrolase
LSMPSYGLSHESGASKRVLVHHSGRELELANSDPAKHNFDRPVDVDRFIAEHSCLIDVLTETGVEVFDISSLVRKDPHLSVEVKSCPNLVFARDSSVMTYAGAILMRMGLPSRRRETPVIRVAHEALGVPIYLRLERPKTFEGGGFALLEGRTAVAGLCSRTTQGTLDAVRVFIFNNDVADKFIEIRSPLTTFT